MNERPTWLIVGLGNPGSQYAKTRHNVGFLAVDELMRRLPPGARRKRFDAQVVETMVDGERLVLMKPETFMNRSGNAVAPAVRWYRVTPERLLVIYDDLDLPFGQLRLRPDGSSGGHNGVESIISRVGTKEFARLRFGISRPRQGDTIGFVLSRFSRDEERRLVPAIKRAADAALAWRQHGIQAAMNEFNRRLPEAPVNERT